MPTEPRRSADDFAPFAPYADDTLKSDRFDSMPQPSCPSWLSADGADKSLCRAERIVGFVITAALAASVALVLAGCATPVSRPAVEVPAQFAAAPASEVEPEAAWWESYQDPVLTDLVRRAERENRDIGMAIARLRAARAGAAVSRSFLLPSVSAGGTVSNLNNGYSGAAQVFVPDIKRAGGGLDVQWELDLSGRLRAGADAAAADALAAQNGVRGVRLLVMSDVASNYFTLVGALRQLETLRAISAAQDQTLRLVQARHRAGLATPFDVERAQTDAETARAQIPPLETVAAVARHRIAVLVGDQAVHAASIEPSRGDVVLPQPQPGQPATLLQRRPDVLALMAQLDAANARRQQAAAEWFPRLFFDASFGRQNVDVIGIGLGSARYLNAAAFLAMPIFNAGRTQAVNDIAEAGQREALLRAEDGMVRALEDVENSLVALSSEQQRAQSLQAAAASAEAALGRAQSLYDRGQIDLLPLLDAQRSRLSVRLGANDSQTQLLLDSVQLYKALGGGWQVFEPAVQTAAQPPVTVARASQP
jgi:NodT family efflux transporter outer membrane factor (OMF) lipoprotein